MEGFHQFFMPKESLFGYGCSQKIAPFLVSKGVSKVLIVTDKYLHESGLAQMAINNFNGFDIEYAFYDEVSPNPTLENVKLGAEYYKKYNCQGIVAIGGGSPVDCAKAMGVLISNGGELEDYIGLEKCTLDSVPLIAVNTTAGTASEISRACLIIDTKENRKIAIKDKHAIPLLAVNDSMLMLKLPAKLTAATGMDALTHAIESYTSQNAYAVSKCSALEAVGLIFKYLDKACEEPQNIEFRDNMIYAEFLAGISFCNSGLGLVHAMSHQLSSTYGLPHGLSNAVLLPYVMEFNAENIPELYDELYLRYHWEEDTKSMKPGEATELLIQEVRRLSEKIGTNVSLEKLNVKKEDFEIMAEKALIDGCYGHTPVKASKPSIIEIYNKAYLG